jgi:hypothetical protein
MVKSDAVRLMNVNSELALLLSQGKVLKDQGY